MLFKGIMTLLALATTTLATPVNITSFPQSQTLSKRATPGFKRGDYTNQQITQIEQGHADAIKMASTVVRWSTSPELLDPIFRKYFNIQDRGAVIEVFKQIVGPKDDGYGNSLLGDIVVVKDYKDDDDGQMSCIENTQAELREFTTEKPKLVVCPLGLKMGGLGKGWEGAPAVTCETWFPRISRKMDSIGFVPLHEYTHWETLMSPVMLPAFQEKATLDEALGPWKVRHLTRHQATWNADSYAWLAQEVWWTQTCRGTHGELEEPEEKDN